MPDHRRAHPRPNRNDLPTSTMSELNPYDPKREEGLKKAPLHLLPSTGCHETSWAFAHGAAKYGPWNWRKQRVCISTYRAAMQRHLDQMFEGEDVDADSGRSHLAHIIASAMILIDAKAAGTLEDDRPPRLTCNSPSDSKTAKSPISPEAEQEDSTETNIKTASVSFTKNRTSGWWHNPTEKKEQTSLMLLPDLPVTLDFDFGQASE